MGEDGLTWFEFGDPRKGFNYCNLCGTKHQDLDFEPVEDEARPRWPHQWEWWETCHDCRIEQGIAHLPFRSSGSLHQELAYIEQNGGHHYGIPADLILRELAKRGNNHPRKKEAKKLRQQAAMKGRGQSKGKNR